MASTSKDATIAWLRATLARTTTERDQALAANARLVTERDNALAAAAAIPPPPRRAATLEPTTSRAATQGPTRAEKLVNNSNDTTNRAALAPLDPNCLRPATAIDAVETARKRARNDDDEDLAEVERRLPEVTGRNLIKLWWSAAGDAKKGVHQGGRKKKSGRQQIADAAAAISQKATVVANPSADGLGLGNCLRAKGVAAADQGGRPYENMTGFLDENGDRKRFRALSYHVAWCDEHDAPPPGTPGHYYSHRCHLARCVNGKHGVWETLAENRARNACLGDGGVSCEHMPVCVPCPDAS